jgi:hypothetical protein
MRWLPGQGSLGQTAQAAHDSGAVGRSAARLSAGERRHVRIEQVAVETK